MILSSQDIACYRKMNSTPAGAILLHILRRMGISQKRLSEISGIRPQHINALIKGTRRFSPSSSLLIESALNLDSDGLFYACQCNYDITMAKMARQLRPNIYKLRKSTFWDVDLEKVDWLKGKRWAILRVLQYGCINDFIEIAHIYGPQSFLEEINNGKILLEPGVRANAESFGLL